jgi:hypothetical protein
LAAVGSLNLNAAFLQLVMPACQFVYILHIAQPTVSNILGLTYKKMDNVEQKITP